ncbi:hypothetical protein ACFLTW_05390 [Chloroflexota bacterium]
MAEKKEEQGQCSCPYCDSKLTDSLGGVCQACHVVVHYCSKCRKPVPKDIEVCPECGGKIVTGEF